MRCRPGCLVATLEYMVLALLDRVCRMVLLVPHEWCPQATVEAVAPVSAGTASSGMPRLRCEQGDAGVLGPQVAVQAVAWW
ncbi:hypothetical protein NDU88_006225 [Pleurodeles waltl]|uniref:Secreted protein n=1 Tax=Pleurodeles waltl TaxID=8319 RepID=A0AAV7QKK2_PLEWA|nr:hypothetical protein NDU88_006225 [Pleurodeles waltl]